MAGKTFFSVYNLQLGITVHRKTTILESEYFGWANLKNASKIQDPLRNLNPPLAYVELCVCVCGELLPPTRATPVPLPSPPLVGPPSCPTFFLPNQHRTEP